MGEAFDDLERRMWRDLDRAMSDEQMAAEQCMDRHFPPNTTTHKTPKKEGGSMPLKTRKPSGIPAWPMVLVAGQEKSGKTYARCPHRDRRP